MSIEYSGLTRQTYNSKLYTNEEILSGKMREDIEALRKEFQEDGWTEKSQSEKKLADYQGFTFVLERKRTNRRTDIN